MVITFISTNTMYHHWRFVFLLTDVRLGNMEKMSN